MIKEVEQSDPQVVCNRHPLFGDCLSVDTRKRLRALADSGIDQSRVEPTVEDKKVEGKHQQRQRRRQQQKRDGAQQRRFLLHNCYEERYRSRGGDDAVFNTQPGHQAQTEPREQRPAPTNAIPVSHGSEPRNRQ